MPPLPPVPVTIEVRLHPAHPRTAQANTALNARVKALAERLARAHHILSTTDLTPALSALEPSVLRASLTLPDDMPCAARVSFLRARLRVHVYRCFDDRPPPPPSPRSPGERGDDAPPLRDAAARALCDVAFVTELPAARLDRAWERLHFAPRVKPALLAYVRAGWALSARGVDRELVGWNGVLLLHGPPGTGKTTLCRALAHKVAVRMDARTAVLVEVRVERLMSKWFSESSQRVREIFDRIAELAECRDFVVVVLDEVESIGLSRKGRADGTEPGDAIRVVNSLLGGIDSVRELRNCVVMCTSNLLHGIDEALVDRADVRLHIDTPSAPARMQILAGVLDELKVKGIVAQTDLGDPIARNGDGREGSEPRDVWSLQRVCEACDQLSGRGLRKLAVMALALVGAGDLDTLPVDEQAFLRALGDAAASLQVKPKSDQ